jgi:hypothetical protein
MAMFITIVLLAIFGALFFAMAIAPMAIEAANRRTNLLASTQATALAATTRPVSIEARRVPVTTGHEPQAA